MRIWRQQELATAAGAQSVVTRDMSWELRGTHSDHDTHHPDHHHPDHWDTGPGDWQVPLRVSMLWLLRCLNISRDGRALVRKKVRRLRPDGSDTDSCPIFDGVQVEFVLYNDLIRTSKHNLLLNISLQIYADPDSCNRFYKCENGSMSLETCENGLLFDQVCRPIICVCVTPVIQEMALTDAIHNYCVYNWRVECGERTPDNTPDSSPGESIRQTQRNI